MMAIPGRPIQSLVPRAGTPDPVLLASVCLLGSVWLIDPAQGRQSLIQTMASFWSILPFLLLSVGAVATARATGIEHHLGSIFRGRMVMMIVAAALFGALSPFCSCGVIPLIAALLAMGVPLAPVMAFWLASPLMDPAMFILTTALLDLHFAIGKTLAAFGMGVLGGFGMQFLLRIYPVNTPLRQGVGGGCGLSPLDDSDPVIWNFWRDAARRSEFLASARGTLVFLGKWLLLAFLVESLMLAYIPAEMVAAHLGGQGPLSVLTAVAVGVPAYLKGFAALPLIAG
ncbi:MAG: permease, partial [Rhodobacteraceae bacterium]|nr:permease [Paracoccaceae bacterium]